MPTLRRLPLLAEAFVALALASALIACVPFRRVAALAAGAGRRRRAATPAQAAAIERALDGWGRRVPWRAVCFQRGLAAQLMLHRRGLSAALHYGAARDEQARLITHVWVRSGEVDVIGHRNARRFGVLAVFPAPSRAGPLLDTPRPPRPMRPATAEPDPE